MRDLAEIQGFPVRRAPILLLNMEPTGTGIVRDYADGRASVQDVLNVCRSYRGPAPHFLFWEAYTPANWNNDADDADDGSVHPLPLFFYCLDVVPEHMLVELLEALIADDPRVLTLTSDNDPGGLLHWVLNNAEDSRDLHRLVIVPGATRLLGPSNETPLHVACEMIDEFGTIHQLINLNPDALTQRDALGNVPLHYALRHNATSACVRRMINMRPETLTFRNDQGETPVERAFQSGWWIRQTNPEDAAALRRIVARHPRSVALACTALRSTALGGRTSLMEACDGRANVPIQQLARVVLEAHPPALVIPCRVGTEGTDEAMALPFEAAGGHDGWEGMATFVQDETVHMALAVVEYVLGVSASVVASGDADTAANLAWFQRHTKETLRELVPEVPLDGASSGLTVAQSLHTIINGNDSGSTVAALVRALFCHEKAATLLREEARVLRTVVLSQTVVDLYRLNRQGRYRPIVKRRRHMANDNTHDELVSAALHQAKLLASLQDSETVESTYLQFREVAHYPLLLAHGRNRHLPDDASGNARKRSNSGNEIYADPTTERWQRRRGLTDG